MQFKPVPEPPERLEDLAAIRRAVPGAARPDGDCCAVVVDRTALESRDEASTWLTFLRALALAREGPDGFERTERDLELQHLRRAFRERVYGAAAVLESLETADEPLTAADVADRVDDAIRTRGRGRDEREGRPEERVRRLLEWAVLLELAERTADGYRAADVRGTDRC